MLLLSLDLTPDVTAKSAQTPDVTPTLHKHQFPGQNKMLEIKFICPCTKFS